MKILIISNMYPSIHKPYSGIFVKNQFKKIKELLDDEDNINIFYLKSKKTHLLGSTLKYIKSFIEFTHLLKTRYNIIHVHYFFPFIILAWIYKLFHSNVKIVVTFHGSDINNHLNNELSKYFFRKFAKSIDFTISVGSELSKEISNKLGLNIDLELSAGVDRRVFYKENNETKEFDFIFIGSFIYRKGIDLIIHSITKNDKSIKYCFVGNGKYINELKKLQNKYDISIFIDVNQNNIRTLLNRSRFLLFPSRQEPFGLVVIEALYSGTPVIISHNCGSKIAVKDHFNGFFLNEISVAEISKAINTFSQLPANKYQSLSKNSVNSGEFYSLDNVAEKLIHVYKDLINPIKNESNI